MGEKVGENDAKLSREHPPSIKAGIQKADKKSSYTL